MKKWIVFLLVMCLILSGCSKKQSASVGDEAQAESVVTNKEEKSNVEPVAEQPNGESQSVEVDKGIFNTEVTLPASMFEGENIDDVISRAKEDGVSEVTENVDGSLTYKLSKSVYNKMMKELEVGLIQTIEELKSGKDFKSIKDVAHNKSFSEFTLIVDKEAYENSFDGFATMSIGIGSMYYQLFNGVSPDDYKATINIKDKSTGDVFGTVVYPDALKE